ncbi:MAG: AEC family transporter [Desulfobulbaceae bacterium]|nr:AEC family transporter [Desulfobulbaceae bacterium]
MENFVLTLGLMVLGKALSKVEAFPKDSAKSFNLYVVYVALPGLILLQVPKLRFSADLLLPILMPWGMLILSALLVLLLGRIFYWPKETTGALLLVVPLGNTSFLGIPMVESFFGAENIPYAVLYDQLGTFLALTTYGTIILAFYAGGRKVTGFFLLKRICTFPPFIALTLALLCICFPYPPLIESLLKPVAASLVPVVMVAVGFQLRVRLPRETIGALGWGLVLKLVAAPLFALGVCSFWEADSIAARVAVFEAGMPPMITAGALAIVAGLAPELTAAMVGVGIVLSFLTLPILYQML